MITAEEARKISGRTSNIHHHILYIEEHIRKEATKNRTSFSSVVNEREKANIIEHFSALGFKIFMENDTLTFEW